MSDKPLDAKSGWFPEVSAENDSTACSDIGPGTFRAVWSDSDESQRWAKAHATWVTEVEPHGERRGVRPFGVIVIFCVLAGMLVVGSVLMWPRVFGS